MRVTRTAAALAALTLSASLAAGAAGTAFASGAAGTPAATGRQHTEGTLTAGQFRVIEDLGALAGVTGALGRAARTEDADPALLKDLRDQLQERTRDLHRSVARSVPSTRPAPRPAERRAPQLADATGELLAAADAVVEAAPSGSGARTDASSRLLAGLAAVTGAAMDEAQIPEEAFRSGTPRSETSGDEAFGWAGRQGS